MMTMTRPLNISMDSMRLDFKILDMGKLGIVFFLNGRLKLEIDELLSGSLRYEDKEDHGGPGNT